tara:strand:+ start:64 stop:426 length:363 start_codon:yes stop_codon:yes gene_type:complete
MTEHLEKAQLLSLRDKIDADAYCYFWAIKEGYATDIYFELLPRQTKKLVELIPKFNSQLSEKKMELYSNEDALVIDVDINLFELLANDALEDGEIKTYLRYWKDCGWPSVHLEFYRNPQK